MNKVIKIENIEGDLRVSSRLIADHFSKRHNDVVKTIENLTTENFVVKEMFIESTFEHRGNFYKEYFMNRDGFTLLAMGFTGKKALEWKLKYIEAFNKMEEELKKQSIRISEKDIAILNIINSNNDIEQAIAIKQFENIVTQPLIEKIEEDKPKVNYHDNVLHSDKLITTTQIAKDLGISARKLNSTLNDLGVIYKQGKVWHLYAEHQDKVPEYCDYHINEFGQTLKWTEKGRKFIIDLLDKQQH